MSGLRKALQGTASATGELLITLGLLVGLYILYLLFWTGIVARAEAHTDLCTLRREWAASVSVQPRTAQPFATIQIPQIRNPEVWPILDGTQQTELSQGVGWYPASDLPGQQGNFAVAAHRRTWGDMFRYLNEVKAGDTVIVQDGNTTYTYRVIENPVYVPANQGDVLDRVPGHSGLAKPGRYITLTTCDPVYDAFRRLIVFGELVSRQTVQQVSKAC
ncbi:class E sortase [Actinospica sp.]|jgi:sortase A|uniref:class E sortase n=1 Tax=Actinospica sp. TaxID=1872142 RepID=UPI002C6107B1|nr:class E sortase [Actinospica sp.]HWG23465.1 class E sortase [Actinospica sp.]